MKFIKTKFNEFKSIFITENILKEKEEVEFCQKYLEEEANKLKTLEF